MSASTPTPGRLEFETTVRGEFTGFAPRHVVAVWLETADGQFVRTLRLFGRHQQRRLEQWKKASGGTAPDAVTGATCPDWGVVRVTWDGTDERGRTLPDGQYTVKVETTWANRAGPILTVPFQKGPVPVHISPPDAPPYHRTRLAWTPES